MNLRDTLVARGARACTTGIKAMPNRWMSQTPSALITVRIIIDILVDEVVPLSKPKVA